MFLWHLMGAIGVKERTNGWLLLSPMIRNGKLFVMLSGIPSGQIKPEFNDALSRRKNQEELDKLITEWTINYDHYEVMQKLQKSGVMAGASLNVEEVVNDPQLKERDFFVDIEYPDKTKITSHQAYRGN